MQDNEIDLVNEPTANYGHTYADYLKFEYDHMVELIRGKIFKMTPAPSSFHQEISTALIGRFFQFLKNKPCNLYHAPFDVVLPVLNQNKNTATTVVQPDLCIICDLDKIDEAGCVGSPDLIIEILSPSTSNKDLNEKYSIYEESGVKEYWIVMPREKLIEVFHLQKERYKRIKTYTSDEKICSVIFPNLEIDLTEIFSTDIIPKT